MLSISLGPLAFPVPPLLLLMALVLASWLARRLAPSAWAAATETSIWLVTLAGLAAARLAHVLRHTAAYADTPWAVLDIRDGGWMFGPGLAAAAVALLIACDRLPLARRALVVSAGAGLASWAALSGLAQWAAPAADVRSLPSVALRAVQAPVAGSPNAAQQPAIQQPGLAALLDGRPLVVNLWASWCGPCRAEMPVLAQAQRSRPDVRFVLVNQGESAQQVLRYLAAERLELKDVWLDVGSALGPALGSAGLPTTVFFSADGQRVDAHFGTLNAAALQSRLARWPEATR